MGDIIVPFSSEANTASNYCSVGQRNSQCFPKEDVVPPLAKPVNRPVFSSLVTMEDRNKNTLKKHRVQLAKELISEEVLQVLIANGILNDVMFDKIASRATNFDKNVRMQFYKFATIIVIVFYFSASQTIYFCHPILEKKFRCNPLMDSLYVNNIKTIYVQLQISNANFVCAKILQMHTIHQSTVTAACSDKKNRVIETVKRIKN